MAIYLNGVKVDLDKRFPDGTLAFKLDPQTYMDRPKPAEIDWYYENDSEILALYCIRAKLLEANIAYVYLRMPYVPNARMDRVKDNADVFTLKYFCDLINSMQFDNVEILDPHSSVTPALLHRCTTRFPHKWILRALSDIADPELVVFYPDEGSMKRYSELIQMPYGFGIKQRDWKTGKILGLQVIGAENLKDRNVLVIDDICSRGGTFFHSAKALKEAGAKDIYLYVTHCENTIFDGELLKGDLIKHIYTTDSIFAGEHNKITVLKLKGGE